jgi:Bacteriodetes cell division protein (FtsL-like)
MSNTPRRKVEQARPTSSAQPKSYNIIDPFAIWINKKLEVNEKLSPSTIKKALWFFFLTFVYIFLQHRFDGMIRRLENTETQLQEARASYISYKSKYLFASKQSELEKKLEPMGFEKNGLPPFKIAKK